MSDNSDNLQLEGHDLNVERVMGFVKIKNLGKAQQVTINSSYLAKVTKFLSDLKNMGFEEVTVTVQKNHPLVIGGKEIGIGIAPRIEEDEE